ncbi:hypothetical protein RCL1_004090 [Eukaryota sp. TZLM3-RCL]
MLSIEHNHGTLEKVLNQRRNTVLTDFDIIVADRSYPCHKAIAFLASQKIATAVSSCSETSLLVPDNLEVSSQVVESILDSFYGLAFEISSDNALEVVDFARYLDYSSLIDLSKTAIKNYATRTHSPSLLTILSELQNDQFRDFSLVYRNVRIKLHKFLLATLCPVFISRFTLQPGDNEWNFTNLLTIQESSFEEFFSSFYKDQITITLENLFDISHLAFYFQMSSLESSCDSLMNSAEPLVSWIFPALESADKADDLRFVDRLASVLVKVDDLAQSDLVALKPDVLYKLCPNVNVFWLSTVLVHSYFHYDYNNQRVWTPNEVQHALNQIDINTLTIDQLYTIIKPLLKVEELYSVLSEFSLTRFTIEKSEIASEWLVWLMVELDKNEPNNELNLTTRFASLLSKVFSKAKLSIIEPLILHPKSFNVYLSNITQQYLILWFIRSLIISWKVENHWTVEIFDELLSIVNLENVDSRELIAVLRPLENISELFDFYCKFMSTKVTPLVIRDYAKTSEELSTSKQELTTKSREFQTVERNLKAENESLKKSKQEVEKKEELERKRREELETETNSKTTTLNNLQSENSKLKSNFSELQNTEKQLKSQFNSEKTRREELEKKFEQEKVNNNNLQSENSKLKSIVDKHAEVIRRAEEEERRRIEEEEERQRLLPSYSSNPLSFIVNNPNNFFNVCGGKVKFLSETRGSNLRLSNDDLRVEKTGGGSNGSNSFIAINRPPSGKVIFTSTSKREYSHIALFDRNLIAGDAWKQMKGVSIYNDYFLPRLPNDERLAQTNTKITRVEVEFTQSNFKITLPQANWSRDYDYEEGWVFGLHLEHLNTSWSIQ